MSAARTIAHQVRYEWKAFWRNPAAAFFSVIFPLLFLVVFNLAFGNQTITVAGGTARASTFYVPAIAALSIVNACFTRLAMGVTISRDAGILKRVRGTPLAAWQYLTANVIVSMLVALLTVAVVVVAGVLFYGITLQARTLPAFVVTLALGAGACSALGLAATAIIPNADAAPAVVNAIALPILFISDVFIRTDSSPAWLNRIAGLFPVRPLSLALQVAFDPFTRDSGFVRGDLIALVLWTVIGIALARRFFSWEPRR